MRTLRDRIVALFSRVRRLQNHPLHRVFPGAGTALVDRE